MPLQESLPEDIQITRFCHQVLQLEQSLAYPDDKVLRRNESQEILYHRLFSEDLPHPLPIRYRLRVLKELVGKIEQCISDWDNHGVSEKLMGILAEILASPLPTEAVAAQQKCYVTYHLSFLNSYSKITLLESRSLISASGTTGLRTWEAALHLGQYLCANKPLVWGRRVLELGAGTGYLAILCAKYLEATQVIASDGSIDIVNFLPENFFLNDLQDSGVLSAMDIKWGHALMGTEEPEWNGGKPVDLLLGADITYDDRIIPSLVATVGELFGLFPTLDVLISATERNKQTYQRFLEACQIRGFDVNEIEFHSISNIGPFYSMSVPIHICRIKTGG